MSIAFFIPLYIAMTVIMGHMIEEDEISKSLIENNMHDLHEQTNYILMYAEGKDFLKQLIAVVVTTFVIAAVTLGKSFYDAETYRKENGLFEKKSQENGYHQITTCR